MGAVMMSVSKFNNVGWNNGCLKGTKVLFIAGDNVQDCIGSGIVWRPGRFDRRCKFGCRIFVVRRQIYEVRAFGKVLDDDDVEQKNRSR